MRIEWVANEWNLPDRFEVCLLAGDPAQPLGGSHQIFLREPWDARTPEALAEALVALLHTPPSTWTAQWHAIDRAAGPPAIAGPNWTMRALR